MRRDLPTHPVPAGLAVAAVLLLLAGCTSRDSAAHWAGGELTFEEIEARARRLPLDPDTASGIDGILERYRQAARETAAFSLLRSDPRTVAAAEARWRTELEGTRRSLIARAYAQQVFPAPPAVDEGEIEAHFRDHREAYSTAGKRQVSHIFKRGERREAVRFLADLKRRTQAGERFAELAREHSDSETRSMGGAIGWVERGTLPPPLEQIVFELAAGESSEPVPVAGGAVLFQVDDAVVERSFSLADVRHQISQELRQAKSRRRIDEHLEDLEVAPDSVLYRGEAIDAALAAARPGDAVLALDGWELTAEQLGERFREQVRAAADRRELSVRRLYEQLARTQRLYLKATASGFPDGERRDELARQTRQAQDAFLDRKLVEEAVRSRLDEATLRQHFETRKDRYQSSLSFRLRALIIEDLSAPQELLARLEALRASWAGSGADLAAEAEASGGEVVDLGWVDFTQLSAFPPKVRRYLLDVGATGLTVPFQHDGSIRMMEIVERREPAPLAFEQARPRLVDDYLRQRGQSLWEQIRAESLDRAGFVFEAQRVRERLRATLGDPPRP